MTPDLTIAANQQANEVRKYVLDTNVLLHDPAALFAFKEHDVHLPVVVLEELDNHKKGVDDLARNARQVARSLDALLPNGSIADGFSLEESSNGKATGRLFFTPGPFKRSGKDGSLTGILLEGKPDNLILQCAGELGAILVTKDINLRVKALAKGVPAQDFRSDRVFSDADVLPTGILTAGAELWEGQAEGTEGVWREGNVQHMRTPRQLPVNSFVVETTNNARQRLWRVKSNSAAGSTLIQLTNREAGASVSLLEPRNIEQTMALSLLNDIDVDCVSLLGVAGTGKTLLALAAGLEQVAAGKYSGVLVTRATVPMGEDIGFLPGTEEEKMGAWMGSLADCYEVLKPTEELKAKVKINSMAFMRGRSFQEKFIIVDEAQNLTTRQIRALLTRVGENSKVVITGNLAQIDTPYLDEGSSGLAWAVKNLQDWPHAGHLILPRGERSRLASYVEAISVSAQKAPKR